MNQERARIWWTGRGTSGNDLSAYFFVRSALLYMRREGRMALVMPSAAMSRQAYAPFRSGEVARLGRVSFRIRFTAAWLFGPNVWPLFPVPSCVLFAEHHDSEAAAPLPDRVSAFAGTLPRRDADRSEQKRLSLKRPHLGQPPLRSKRHHLIGATFVKAQSSYQGA